MLYGLLLHGATIGSDPLFYLIKVSSDHFRMAAFFLVSGYFSALVASRQPCVSFLRKRTVLVVVPFVAAVVVLNPITNWLIQSYHGGGQSLSSYFLKGGWQLPSVGPEVWHLHLWFLVSLFFFTLLTPLVLWVFDTRLAASLMRRLEAFPRGVQLTLLALAVGLSMVVWRALNDQLLQPVLPERWHFLVQASCNYVTYYMMGVLGFRYARTFRTMHSFFWPGLLLWGALYALHPVYTADWPRDMERLSYWMVRSGLIFLIVCALLWVFELIVKKGSPILSRLTDGVYSFYLFHFLVIYILANLMRMVTDDMMIIYAVIVLAGFPLLFLIHEKLIAPSAPMRFLFNGKMGGKTGGTR